MRISDWSSDVCSSDLSGTWPAAKVGATARRPASVDAELLELVAQGAEGDAQGGGGLGLVVAVFLQGLLDGGAFDFLDVRGQGAAGGFARTQGARVGRGGRGAGVAGGCGIRAAEGGCERCRGHALLGRP